MYRTSTIGLAALDLFHCCCLNLTVAGILAALLALLAFLLPLSNMLLLYILDCRMRRMSLSDYRTMAIWLYFLCYRTIGISNIVLANSRYYRTIGYQIKASIYRTIGYRLPTSKGMSSLIWSTVDPLFDCWQAVTHKGSKTGVSFLTNCPLPCMLSFSSTFIYGILGNLRPNS